MSQQLVLTERKPMCALRMRGMEGVRRVAGRMVLALGGLPHAAVVERYFQERGWRVALAGSGQEARALARKAPAAVVVLVEETVGDESGWLIAWKLLHERPDACVIVVGNGPEDVGRRRAEFVGATAYVSVENTAAGIAVALAEAGLPA
jgi:ActR/RegA family two-component response regulator